MKKLIACVLILIFAAFPVTAYADDWDTSVPTEISAEIQEIFDKAMTKLIGAKYTPVAVLGKDGDTYCILCKTAAVYPGATQKNTLVYVNESGIKNIYDLWIDKHAEKEAPAEAEPEKSDIQYVLYLGTNDKDTNTPVFTEAEAKEKAKEILVRHFGGFTIQEAEGGWLDEEKLYQEYTLVIYLSDTTEQAVHAAADELVEAFHQSAVLIQTNPTRTEFYGG